MATDTLPRTIEIKTADVQLTGQEAGMIEVPIYIGQERQRNFDFHELFLEVEGEERLLHSAGCAVAKGLATFLFFSKHVSRTHELPEKLVLHWGESIDHDRCCGMEIPCQNAS